MAYLQQIATPTPTKKAGPLGDLLNGPLFKVLIGLAVLAIVIIIIGIATSGSGETGNHYEIQ